jgi:ubiquinone/menaquinone biosynthesis C-methylase UbiE
MESEHYYQRVARYYDADSVDFEERYWANPVLQRIRQAFREEVKKCAWRTALEIGFGTGLDVCHFATIFRNRHIYGIDVSPAMWRQASRKVQEAGLQNVTLTTGVPEELSRLFPNVKFDLIYVFFGALNTSGDLKALSPVLKNHLHPNGRMVLTFVNKWYLADIFIHLLKGRPGRAFKRYRSCWGGYSQSKKLDSRCFSPPEVRKFFHDEFIITHTAGFSLLYPAWYRSAWIGKFGKRLSELLWQCDRLLNRTFLWPLGEYALYEMRHRP